MRKYGLARGTRTAVAACMALAFLTACSSESAAPSSSGTFFGPSQPMGNGTIKTFVTVDEAGAPSEVGLRLTRSTLEGLPQDTGLGQTLMLDFPDQAGGTAFDHVMLNWNAHGHEPEALFSKPHFDFHFDMVDMATIEGIKPDDPNYAAKAERLPDAKYLPESYVLPPGPPAAEQAVPGMGVHLVDGSDTSLVPGSYDFQQIIINGAWDGRYTFIEPMITRDYLLTQPALEQPLKQPQAYQKSAYYPTTYTVSVDEQTQDYVISLSGMTMRQAS